MRIKLAVILFLTAISAVLAAADVAAADSAIIDQASPLILSTPGQTYQLQTSLRFSGNGVYIAAPNVTLDLNGHTIYYGGQNENTENDPLLGAHGVVLYLSWHNTEIRVPEGTNPTKAVIKNGSIVHEGTGAVSHAIYGYRGLGATVRGIHAEANGKDSHSVYIHAGEFSLIDDVLVSHASASFGRQAGPANVHGETLVAQNNVLIGGNSGFAALDDSQIIGNVIAHDGHVTNGYGVWLDRAKNVVVRDNLILPPNGRGVLLNASTKAQVLDNVILHLERSKAEVGEASSPPAIRSRSACSGNTVQGNTALGIAGSGPGLTSASGLYLTENGMGEPSFYTKNSFTTILIGARDANHYAVPVTFAKYGYVQQSRDAFSGNVLRSNDALVRVQGSDGSLESSIPMTGNALAFVTGDTAQSGFLAVVHAKLAEIGMARRVDAMKVVGDATALVKSLIEGVPLSDERATWYLKDGAQSAAVDGTFLDNQAANGVDLQSAAVSQLNAGLVSVKVGQTVPVTLAGPAGVLDNTAVTVTTDRSDTYGYTTSATGGFAVPVIEFGLEKLYPINAPVVKNVRALATIAVKGYKTVSLDNSRLLSHKNDASPLQIRLVPLDSTDRRSSNDNYAKKDAADLKRRGSAAFSNKAATTPNGKSASTTNNTFGSVIVVTNRASVAASFRLSCLLDGVLNTREFHLANGDCQPIPLTGPGRLAFQSGREPKHYRVLPSGMYYFYQDAAQRLELGQIGAVHPKSPVAEASRSAVAEAFSGQPTITRQPVVVPIKILYDDAEASQPSVWEARLRHRFDEASKLFEKQCFVTFKILAVESWRTNPGKVDLLDLLTEFERAVDPAPARLAIGFYGRQVEIPRDLHLGGTRGTLHSHMLIREWVNQNTEHERLELLVHELGHFLGAAHSPEQSSVMRPALGDRRARMAQFRLVFDPLNTLAMCYVSDELRLRPQVRFGGIDPGTKIALQRIYQDLSLALPDDSAAKDMLRLLQGTR